MIHKYIPIKPRIETKEFKFVFKIKTGLSVSAKFFFAFCDFHNQKS